MNWEELTSPEFEKAVTTSHKICVLPIGVVEKHGDHLPLGQDYLYIHDVCSRAAKQERVLVFPPFYLGKILEARHVPGTIALNPDLLLPVLESVCDEIGRNGFEKILIVNGHGGNIQMLAYFVRTLLGKQKPYMTFISWFPADNKQVKRISKAKVDGHGGERETSSMLYLRPDLVKLGRYADYGLPLGRAAAYRKLGLDCGIWWYADFPGHFAGDKVRCTRTKGEVFVKAHVRHIAEQIRLLKRDDTPMKLYREFLLRSASPANRYP